MTNPQPEEKGSLWQSILKAAEGLDQPLRFIIVFGVLLAVLFIAAPNISGNQLILLAILLIGGMILYVWWDYRHFRHPADAVSQPPDDNQPPGANWPPPEQPRPTRRQNREDLAQTYLWHIFDQCQHLSMADVHRRAQQKPWEKLPIDAIFTTLDVAATGMERTGRKWGFLGQVGLDEPGQREPALAAISREKRLVLLGQPGSGKSTLVSFIAYCLAGEALAQAGVDEGQARLKTLHDQGWTLPTLLPVRIILRDYAARGLPAGQGLWEFLTAELSQPKPGLGDYLPELERHLQRRGGLLLLDGLDEVPLAHQRRDQLREAIKTFARDFDKVRLLVTSRPYAYDASWQLPGFARADLLDFDADQINSYIESWYRAAGQKDPELPAERADHYARQLKEEMERNRNLADLAQRPLLLALIVSLHRWRHGEPLPEKREELYHESVELLLDMWQRPKRIDDERGPRQETSAVEELGIGLDALRQALSKVAFEIHKDQPELRDTADIPAGKLAGELFNAPGRKRNIEMDDVIAYLKERAGLLVERGEDSEGQAIYAFPHRTFQEYLAACYLADHDHLQLLANLARQEPDRWREVLLLAVAKAERGFKSSCWLFVNALCGQPFNAAAPTPANQWGARLAGQALLESAGPALSQNNWLDGLNNANRQSVWRVCDWLAYVATAGDLPAPERAGAGVTLGQLDDPHLALMTVDGLEFCYVPPGPFWMGSDEDSREVLGKDAERPLHQTDIAYPYWLGRFPITNAQFAEFVGDGGYRVADYWTEAAQHGFWRDGQVRGYTWRPDEENDWLWLDRPYDYGRPYALPNHPAVGLNWYESLAFTRWLTTRWRSAGILPAGWSIVLPSEAEWEKAARGGLEIPTKSLTQPLAAATLTPDIPRQANPLPQRRFPWGDELPTAEHANYDQAGVGAPSRPGAFPAGASPYGCQEMSGNVWEWTRTLWGQFVPEKSKEDKIVFEPLITYPYKAEDGRENLAANDYWPRVLRGSSFANEDDTLRAAFRGWNFPGFRIRGFGFRVAAAPFFTSAR
jgi:formylglycine-generating enzyme required for sulfatase activity